MKFSYLFSLFFGKIEKLMYKTSATSLLVTDESRVTKYDSFILKPFFNVLRDFLYLLKAIVNI